MSPRQSKNIFVSSDTQSNNTGSKVGFEEELIKINKFLKMFVGIGSSWESSLKLSQSVLDTTCGKWIFQFVMPLMYSSRNIIDKDIIKSFLWWSKVKVTSENYGKNFPEFSRLNLCMY